MALPSYREMSAEKGAPRTQASPGQFLLQLQSYLSFVHFYQLNLCDDWVYTVYLSLWLNHVSYCMSVTAHSAHAYI